MVIENVYFLAAYLTFLWKVLHRWNEQSLIMLSSESPESVKIQVRIYSYPPIYFHYHLIAGKSLEFFSSGYRAKDTRLLEAIKYKNAVLEEELLENMVFLEKV
ncbi:TPA: hypothetical protein DCZ39_04095 [Patescibacteria group bacterium]|nr:hypothetical protein [Candidatus Gracilibacteria bacterium]